MVDAVGSSGKKVSPNTHVTKEAKKIRFNTEGKNTTSFLMLISKMGNHP